MMEPFSLKGTEDSWDSRRSSSENLPDLYELRVDEFTDVDDTQTDDVTENSVAAKDSVT